MVDRTLRRIFILSGIVLLLWVLYLLKPVVIPFVVAFFMAYLFSPLVEQFCKVGLPRWLSISIVFIGIGIVLTLAVWYIIPLVWKQLIIARDSIPVGINWINSTFLPWVSSTFNIEEMEIDTSHMTTIVMDYVQTNYSADSIQAMALRVAQSGLNFIQIGGTVVLIPIIAFYFLLDWQRMLDSLRRLIPRPYEQSTLAVVQECHSVLGAFVKGQFLVMILLGVVYATGLQLIGLEVGLIIGMVAGLASIIPYLGFAVGIVAAIIATFLQFGIDWMQLVLVLVVFMIGQAVEGYILQPFLLGDKIGLSPVAVVFAVLAGAQLAGFMGMLIALPVAAVIVVLLRHLRDYYEKSYLYGQPVVVSEDAMSGDISIDTAQVHLDIELDPHSANSLQHTEKSSKIKPSDQQNS
ncbi:chloramphenicol efflux transporter CxpE [Acinetobacter sp. PW68]|uniref:chloramphenicol efflux transporter CxpE n=1 Tax=Acinetobacter sp. PW68 TaxID=2865162 RepID=UPI001E49A354|nr:AI-2E family transporter [Acinetobacter sp. PW68]MCD0187518.1 AI-2E family transporter [Acinetobacter sp. PW68]